jgi:catechol 2,3-dioxygenase-like lactoylglutathione lyase family enzyme
MRVFRIAAPALDLQRSCAFYEAVLGITPDDTVPTRVYFHCEGVILAVIDWQNEPLGPFHPTPEHMYLATDELDAVHARAGAAAAGDLGPIERRSWGERSFYCTDPSGNLLCFVDDTTLFLGRGADWS